MNHQAVVEQAHLFANANHRWATPEGARDQCLDASSAFIEHLLAAGLISRERSSGWYWEVLEVAVICGVSHHVARVGTTLVDLTARQYDPSADYPKIWQDEWFQRYF